MNKNVKITKKDRFNAIIAILNENGADEELVQFCENEIVLLEKKSAKAKATAEAKKNEKDDLCEVVESLLTEEWQTREDIFNHIEGEDLSLAKVSYRLSKLVAMGAAEKGEVTVPGKEGQKSRKLTAYRLPTEVIE